MKIALGQINTTVGDFSGNAQKIILYAHRAADAGAGLILFPELSICGYPPRDLLEKPAFLRKNQESAEAIAAATRGIAVICGAVTPAAQETGKRVANSALLMRDGKIEFVQSKMLLPTYDVFDELRHFAPAEKQELVPFCGKQMALTICEDAWNDKHFWPHRLYRVDPVEQLMKAGGNFVLNISASPWHLGKRETRCRMLTTIATEYRVPVVLVNQVGGNDSLIFDGSSLVVAPDGRVVARAKSFEEDLVYFDPDQLSGDMNAQTAGREASAYAALVLGTRDYVRKCGFQKVLVGLSGGIDSALVACIAADALGPENVMGVGMPTRFSSAGSIEDARLLAQNLGISFETVPIQAVFDTYLKALQPAFRGCKEDATEENIQSRVRGSVLMALSNKRGALVLSTGNKSELGVGYCTLYGDMVGGLAVISDVPKTMVYALSHWVNRERERIPQATISKPPSAELRPGQKDTDVLPPYEVLDAILEDYVEDYKTAEEIAGGRGFELSLVKSIIRMIERSEYKRQQAAPGLKITEKAFGMGRRFPIAQKSEV
ncbi:MAG: NAD+ synthase [Candidatus Koribacter versatilis]|uniref:Glutamine-dependent NAD(+) synthetase n=1 Tax=Candidatus Korobacter versatilis TaxID=658062 RepID=A0A932ENM7_9BACT|nr:NAD+ synthase [Candidatus Koribacter versatilis]